MMKKANDIFPKIQQLDEKFEYAYFSRNSLRKALLWTTNDFETSLRYLTPSKYIPFSEIAAYYGIEKEWIENEPKFIEYWDRDILYTELKNEECVRELYEKYYDCIKRISEEQYKLLVQYLKQLGISDNNIAIVDIGWHGTMQAYLEEVLTVSENNTIVTGYYVGIAPSTLVKGKTYGYLYHDASSKLRKELLCFFGVIEKFFQSEEGSTKGYTFNKTHVSVAKEPYEYQDDSYVTHKLKVLQDGALNFIHEKIQCKDEKEDNLQTYAEPLIRFGKKPTLYETKLFKFLYNTDGMKVYYLPQKPLYQYNLKEFLHALSNSCWKTGFMKSAFKLPISYYFIYEMMKK